MTEKSRTTVLSRVRKRATLLLALALGAALVAIAVLIARDPASSEPNAAAGSAAGTPTEMGVDHGGHGTMASATMTDMTDMTDMDHDMDSQGMTGMDMRPVDVSNAAAMPAGARGNQPLVPTVGPDGVKEFDLTASVIQWHILPNVQIGAYAYNQQLSGPEIRVTEGDAVRIRFRNDLPEATSVHWHGLILPNEMDGAAGVTQDPVEPGETFIYEFEVTQTGTYFYHTHKEADRQQALGLYGALIVEPAGPSPDLDVDVDYTLVLGEWTVGADGETRAAMNHEGMLPNYFTINGKSYPETETIRVKVGDRVRLRFVGSGQFIHPMHVHGGPFEIVETDGNPVPEGARLTKDTLLVGPGERYDVIWVAQEPGKWLIHCHINDHITNNGVEVDGGGGLTMLIEVT